MEMEAKNSSHVDSLSIPIILIPSVLRVYLACSSVVLFAYDVIPLSQSDTETLRQSHESRAVINNLRLKILEICYSMYIVQNTITQTHLNKHRMPPASSNGNTLDFPANSLVRQFRISNLQSTLPQLKTEVSDRQTISPTLPGCPADMPSDAGDVKNTVPVESTPSENKTPSGRDTMSLSYVLFS
ncbi:hypothetical protein CSUB01_12559 [Colletotrichum sublineola]|uniref:Uncharacterized protein n=1 Tax=Colletotrichum sublineola TaxID=1173701 RepID=A0A066XQZ3_COLSU|nr:hypothetical protein CSUB01_12559 [Colletotrichum sublineola]